MNELFLLYLWTRLDAVNALFEITVVCSFFTTLCAFFTRITIFSASYWDNEAERKAKTTARGHCEKAIRISAIVGAIAAFCAVVVPTKKDAAIIAGGWLVKEAATSEIAKDIGERTYKLVMGKLDAELEKLEKK